MVAICDNLFHDKYREAILCEYQRELELIKQMIEIAEEATNEQSPVDTWSHDGICHMFAKSIIDYAKMAYDNMQLGHFHATHMIFRVILENCVCLDVVQRYPEHELWKYYMVKSYRDALKSTGDELENNEQAFLEEMYHNHDIEEEFYIKSKKKGSKKAFAYIDKNYGWNYKIHSDFTFSGLCSLIDQREYKDFKLMSMYSHGTAIHLKIGGFASMDHIFNMLSFFYYALNRFVDLYCCETVDTKFEKIGKKLERVFERYINDYELQRNNSYFYPPCLIYHECIFFEKGKMCHEKRYLVMGCVF